MCKVIQRAMPLPSIHISSTYCLPKIGYGAKQPHTNEDTVPGREFHSFDTNIATKS
jgi:hypothetical protein